MKTYEASKWELSAGGQCFSGIDESRVAPLFQGANGEVHHHGCWRGQDHQHELVLFYFSQFLFLPLALCLDDKYVLEPRRRERADAELAVDLRGFVRTGFWRSSFAAWGRALAAL